MEERGWGWGAGQPMPNHYTTESSLDEQEGKKQDGMLEFFQPVTGDTEEVKSGRRKDDAKKQHHDVHQLILRMLILFRVGGGKQGS